MAKHHITSPTNTEQTRCGYTIASPAWNGGALPIAEHARDATCALCLRVMLQAIESGEEEAPFVAAGPAPTRLGAREIGAAGASAIETVRRGEDEPARRGWPSPEAAVRSYVRALAEGASLRSTSDPDRAHRVQMSKDQSLGGREHAMVDRHRTVSLALTRAQDDVKLARACPLLTPSHAYDVYVLAIVGRAQLVPTRLGGHDLKGRWLDWIGYSTEGVVDYVHDHTSIAITPQHVEAIVKHFTWAVREALLASGEMGTRRREEPVRERATRAWDPLRRLREAASR